MSDVDVIIVGAGAAGLGAAMRAHSLGLSFEILEASHRIGGRAYTEILPNGQPFDLGCHWLHSASINPFTEIADRLGFHYSKAGFARNLHVGGHWGSAAEQQDFASFLEICDEAITAAADLGDDKAVSDVTDREHRWSAAFDYIMSLNFSVDSDQVSVLDHVNYRDTEENWPLRDGYGALLARFASEVPVRLNTAVRRLDWSGAGVCAETAQGTLSGRVAIVTVSTGVLAAGEIRFSPELPDWKAAAIASLPVGCHNRICLVLDGDPFGPDAPPGVMVQSGGDDSVPMSFRLRPFDHDYVVGVTGGRFGDWLERAGVEASVDLALEELKKIFGSGIARQVVGRNVTAWRGDPWVRGAYSAALPGHHGARAVLARPLADRLFFAGEACSERFYTTCHGAYLTGIDVAETVAGRLRNGQLHPERAGSDKATPAVQNP